MIIKNVSEGDIEEVLQLINPYWNDNIEFGTFKEQPYYNGWKATLRVRDVNQVGHSITRPAPWTNKIKTACWHVHFTFFLELPDDAVVFNGKHWIERKEPDQWKPWYESGIPIELLCECERSRMAYHPRNPKRIAIPHYIHRA